jgi:hypothetical protein
VRVITSVFGLRDIANLCLGVGSRSHLEDVVIWQCVISSQCHYFAGSRTRRLLTAPLPYIDHERPPDNPRQPLSKTSAVSPDSGV